MPKKVGPLGRIPRDDHEPAGHRLEQPEPRETVDRRFEDHVARPEHRRKRLCGNRLEHVRCAGLGSRDAIRRDVPDLDIPDSPRDPDRAASGLRPRASGPIDQHPRRPACSIAARGREDRAVHEGRKHERVSTEFAGERGAPRLIGRDERGTRRPKRSFDERDVGRRRLRGAPLLPVSTNTRAAAGTRNIA